jgi:succinate dehydrogenase / fumarate reductase cytochrome b subunit
MSNFLTSSIGKKFLMSLSGFFLISFLSVHLTANLFLLFGSDAYNEATNFMGTNPIIQIMQPVLAIGFILHIFYASYLTLQNQKARPENYAVSDLRKNSRWESRNMYVLGTVIFTFLVVHLINFFWKIKFSGSDLLKEVEVNGVNMENAYALVTSLFNPAVSGTLGFIYSGLYILGAAALGLHINHGFWAAFQTLGLSNNLWRKRLEVFGSIFAVVIACGFTIIPLYFLIF